MFFFPHVLVLVDDKPKRIWRSIDPTLFHIRKQTPSYQNQEKTRQVSAEKIFACESDVNQMCAKSWNIVEEERQRKQMASNAEEEQNDEETRSSGRVSVAGRIFLKKFVICVFRKCGWIWLAVFTCFFLFTAGTETRISRNEAWMETASMAM